MTDCRCLAPQNPGQRALLRGCDSPRYASWASPASVPSASPAQALRNLPCKGSVHLTTATTRPTAAHAGAFHADLSRPTCHPATQCMSCTAPSNPLRRTGGTSTPGSRLTCRTVRPALSTTHTRASARVSPVVSHISLPQHTANDACCARTMHFLPLHMPCRRRAQPPCYGYKGCCHPAVVLSRFAKGMDDKRAHSSHILY